MRLIRLRTRASSWIRTLGCVLPLSIFGVFGNAAWCASDDGDGSAALLHILDYISVDYSGAVKQGQVISTEEFTEMNEFAEHAVVLAQALPMHDDKASIVQEVESLRNLIAQKHDIADIRASAQHISQTLVSTYHLRVTPQSVPSLAGAATLYEQYCSACHGAIGDGKGPAASGLQPSPANFHDTARMAQRSVFSLFNSISLGVSGTSMQSFSSLPENDRWALALYVAGLSVPADARKQAELAWRDSKDLPDAKALVFTLSPSEAHTRLGATATLLQAHLWTHPQLLNTQQTNHSPIDVSLALLDRSRSAYQNGDREQAYQLAVNAYLEGFETIEPQLTASDPELVRSIEREMISVRQELRSNTPSTTLDAHMASIKDLLERARGTLTGTQMSAAAIFASALIILLREGIEALLVVAAVMAFLVRTERREALAYVHAGWIAAVLLGLATWAAATYFINISGASREMTEGVTAIVAAVMLVYVGYWLHTRSAAGAWQHFIEHQVGMALARKTLWGMSALAFIAVYREMFEIVLFYQALWVEAGVLGRSALFGGIASGFVLLIAIAVLMLKYGTRLPLGTFFSSTAILLLILSVVMTGEGVHALQEAGAVASTAIRFPEISWFGVFPTLQGMLAQTTIGLVILITLLLARRQARVER